MSYRQDKAVDEWVAREREKAEGRERELLHRAEAAEDRVWELERGVAEIARIAGSLMEGVEAPEESDG